MPHVNLFDGAYVLPWVPKRARQVLKMQDEDEFYLLHDIQCRDSRPIRILSQAQMAEIAILLGHGFHPFIDLHGQVFGLISLPVTL